MNLKKRGQITIFIIIGVILLIAVALILLLRSTTVEKELEVEEKAAQELPSELAPIESYIQSCLEKASEEALWQVGAQGGYINIPDPKTTFQGQDLPYLLDGTISNYPTLSEIERQTADKIVEKFENCSDLSIFEKIGFNITKLGATQVNITIANESTFIKLTYPLSIKKGKSETKIDIFIVRLPIRLGTLYYSSLELIKKTIATQPYNIAQDCSSYDKNQLTNVYFKDNKIIQFMDYSAYQHEFFQTYIFQFAVRNVEVMGGCFD
ncbi:MAG: hypothetical protein KAT77_04930 [Nanoarchaeota archaeon]|nr:hypothetical protein [Nanoarchaeota archaeon]